MRQQGLSVDIRQVLTPLLVSAVTTVGVYLLSGRNFLLVHTLAESFSIIVAGATFMLVWNTWTLTDNGYLKTLGIAMLFIGIVDLVHTLAYEGLDVFPGFGPNLPTQLWIAARYVQSLSLVIAPALLHREVDRRRLAVGYAAVTAALVAAIFTGVFPDCYVPGQGLTPFKIASELVIVLLLGAAIGRLIRHRDAFAPAVFQELVAAIAFTILAELAFTLYISVYGTFNLLGHVFKIAAFFSLYRAILETGLRRPYGLLFRDVHERNQQLQAQVADRERAEAALRESNEKLSLLFDLLPVGVSVIDENRQVVKQNRALGEILAMTEAGLARGDYRHRRYLRADGSPMPPADFPSSRVIAGEDAVHDVEIGVVKEDGDVLWTNVSAVACGLGDWRAVIVTSDVTANKEAEAALQTSEQRYRRVSELISDYAYAFSVLPGGAFEADWVTDAFQRLTGYTRRDIPTGEGWIKLIHPGDRDEVGGYLRSLVAGEAGQQTYRIVTKTGEVRWVHSHDYPVWDAAGEHVVQIIGAAQDITERRHAEEALRQSRARFRKQFEFTPIPTFIWAYAASSFRLLDFNRAVDRMTEGQADRFLGLTAEEIYPDRPDLVARFHRCMREESVITYEAAYHTRGIDRDRTIIFTFVYVAPDLLMLHTEDVTEQRQAEAALEQRIVALTRPLDNAAAIAFADLFNLDDIQRLQDEFADATGVASLITHPAGTPITELSNACRLCRDIIRETDEGRANCYASDAQVGRARADGPTIGPCMSGGLWEAGAAIHVGGHHVANWLIGQVRDATQTEAEIRAYAREIGADEEAAAAAFHEVPAMSREQFRRVAQALFTLAKQLSTMAYQNVQQARFIAERKRAEEALHESETQFRTIVNALPQLISYTDKDLIYRFVNQTYQETFKIKPEQILGRSVREVIGDDAFREARPHIEDVLQGTMVRYHERYDYAVGGARDIDGILVPDVAEDGEVRGYYAVLTDITPYMEIQAELRRTTERLQIEHEIDRAILAAQSPQEIATAVLDRLHHLIPNQRSSITEIAQDRERGRDIVLNINGAVQPGEASWQPLSAVGDAMLTRLRQGRTYAVPDITARAHPSSLERRLLTNGVRTYASVPLMVQQTLVGTLNVAGETPGALRPDQIAILEEVAASLAVALQQARLLEQTRQDAETKELLLREVNHRVKNNLDAIIGLLYVERRHAPPEALPTYQPIMEDLTRRIGGLAQVHQMLSEVEWAPLNLSALAEQIIRSAARSLSDAVRVTLDIPPAAVHVRPAQAHHLALILNELTTNTLKHGVAGRDAVEISVHITRRNGTITLVYRNDGPGYPEDVLRLARHNAGLDIVKRSVRKNLQGSLRLRNDHGAVAEIQFSHEEGKDASR